MAILVQNGYVITQDAQQRELAKPDILTEGDRISAMSQNLLATLQL